MQLKTQSRLFCCKAGRRKSIKRWYTFGPSSLSSKAIWEECFFHVKFNLLKIWLREKKMKTKHIVQITRKKSWLERIRHVRKNRPWVCAYLERLALLPFYGNFMTISILIHYFFRVQTLILKIVQRVNKIPQWNDLCLQVQGLSFDPTYRSQRGEPVASIYILRKYHLMTCATQITQEYLFS